MKPVILSLFSPSSMIQQLKELLGCDQANVYHHTFPDGETYLQIQGDINDRIVGRDVIIFDSLHQPDPKILPLIFLAATARELGAKRVGLVCPYLAYMRQDKRFLPGEGVTSTYFAKIISQGFDWLVTVDPHLHRRSSLDEIYTIPSLVVRAAPTIANWVLQNVEKPIFIGPDGESEQWVSSIANQANAPFVILEKVRRGDKDVSIVFPDFSPFHDHTPILMDDIVSTGRTMIQTVVHLNEHQMKPALCIGVHGIFAQDAYLALLETGVARVITCNTIPHPTNEIDLLPVLSQSIQKILTA